MYSVATTAIATISGASTAGSNSTNAYLKIEAPAPYVKMEVTKP